jgi:plastocyanin
VSVHHDTTPRRRPERNDEEAAYFGTVIVSDDQPSGGPPATVATVTLIDESYQPPALEAAVGATVTWEDIDGDDDHTVASAEGAFDGGVHGRALTVTSHHSSVDGPACA